MIFDSDSVGGADESRKGLGKCNPVKVTASLLAILAATIAGVMEHRTAGESTEHSPDGGEHRETGGLMSAGVTLRM
jgi:hypothetical protein